MSQSVYKVNRRQLLSLIMSARRCQLDRIVRRYQFELVELREKVMA
jgi:hypothetical protein